MTKVHKCLLVGNKVYAVKQMPIPPESDKKFKVDSKFKGASLQAVPIESVHLDSKDNLIYMNFIGVPKEEQIIVDPKSLIGPKHELFPDEVEGYRAAVKFVDLEKRKAKSGLEDREMELRMLLDRVEKKKQEIEAMTLIIKGLDQNKKINKEAMEELLKQPLLEREED